MAKKHRSPNYPSVNLAEAIRRTRQLWDQETKHWAQENIASEHWGFKSRTGGRCLKRLVPVRRSGNFDDAIRRLVGRQLLE